MRDNFGADFAEANSKREKELVKNYVIPQILRVHNQIMSTLRYAHASTYWNCETVQSIMFNS